MCSQKVCIVFTFTSSLFLLFSLVFLEVRTLFWFWVDLSISEDSKVGGSWLANAVCESLWNHYHKLFSGASVDLTISLVLLFRHL